MPLADHTQSMRWWRRELANRSHMQRQSQMKVTTLHNYNHAVLPFCVYTFSSLSSSLPSTSPCVPTWLIPRSIQDFSLFFSILFSFSYLSALPPLLLLFHHLIIPLSYLFSFLLSFLSSYSSSATSSSSASSLLLLKNDVLNSLNCENFSTVQC